MNSKQEKRIFIGNQLKRILNGDKDGYIKLQIVQGTYKTDHLYINEDQLLKIEKILIEG